MTMRCVWTGKGLIQITQPVPKGTVKVFVPLPGTVSFQHDLCTSAMLLDWIELKVFRCL